jgi:pentatricopeptide repeat protein
MQGKEIHGYVIRHGLEQDVKVGTSLLDMYYKCGKVDFADYVFARMPLRTIKLSLAANVSLVTYYAKLGCVKDAEKVFDTMLVPDIITWKVSEKIHEFSDKLPREIGECFDDPCNLGGSVLSTSDTTVLPNKHRVRPLV